MQKFLVLILALGLLANFSFAALAPELAVNDAQKICVVYGPDGYSELKEGWKLAPRPAENGKPLWERLADSCPAGYQILKKDSSEIEQLRPQYQSIQMQLDLASAGLFLIALFAAFRLLKIEINSISGNYPKAILVMVAILAIVLVLRSFALPFIYPCHFMPC